jgi:hypothetical protein
MTNKYKKCVAPPYKCNWCGEPLHSRYGRAIYTDDDGNNYCSEYCIKLATKELDKDMEIR